MILIWTNVGIDHFKTSFNGRTVHIREQSALAGTTWGIHVVQEGNSKENFFGPYDTSRSAKAACEAAAGRVIQFLSKGAAIATTPPAKKHR